MRACIIFNPAAKGEKAKRLRRDLERLERECSLRPTLEAGAARLLASEAVANGFDTIVAAGGDGTINEVINGIADAPDGFHRVRLGVIPTGTVNVFARELGIPFALSGAWELIRRGKETRVDLPRMTFQSREGTRSRYFAQMAGCGLDAQAVELVDWELKKKIGQFAYVFSAARAIRRQAVSVTATAGDRSHAGPLVLLGNGRLYGGPIPVFHMGDLRDGQLDVCVFPRINWFVILRYSLAFLSPKFLIRRGEHHFQAPKVALDAPAPMPIELDGELVGHSPASCTVEPGILRVLIS